MRTKWTQEPPNDLMGCGRDEEEIEDDEYNQDEDVAVSVRKQDAARLGEFIGRAGMVVSAILEENLSLYSFTKVCKHAQRERARARERQSENLEGRMEETKRTSCSRRRLTRFDLVTGLPQYLFF